MQTSPFHGQPQCPWLHHMYTDQPLKSYATSVGRILNGTSVNMLIPSAVIELPNPARCHL
jgi:hypothetical protein